MAASQRGPGMTFMPPEIIQGFRNLDVQEEPLRFENSWFQEGNGTFGTYKVRSLGMWLKLETGMLLMLLLFSVLGKKKIQQKSHKWRYGEQEFGCSAFVTAFFLDHHPLQPLIFPPRQLSLWHPIGNITPHSTQMGTPRTSHAHLQPCVQMCVHYHDHGPL